MWPFPGLPLSEPGLLAWILQNEARCSCPWRGGRHSPCSATSGVAHTPASPRRALLSLEFSSHVVMRPKLFEERKASCGFCA